MNPNNPKRTNNSQGSGGNGKPQSSRSGGLNNRRPNNGPAQNKSTSSFNSSRGAAIRAQRRAQDDAQRIASQYLDNPADKKPSRANFIDDQPRLHIIGLGGMDGGGSKNTILIEYMNDAVIIDCGNDLGVDLPGINYGICDMSYLETIRHKLRAYIITHGHLDHIGGLPHIVPKYPAPIYGSKFTIGRVEEIFNNFSLPMPDGFELRTVMMNEDTHERLKIGPFFVELVRVTHSIPGSTVVVLDTPVGRIINTGDFRLDPNPLDHEKTDVERLKQLGDEGVLALLSESTTVERAGRTPSESTIEQSFIDIIDQAPGRIFVGLFSTNMNRVQMIVNAAAHHNRKIVMDGRSMVSTLEMAVRHGFMKIPKGTFVPMSAAGNIPDNEIVVVCTGSQGEPNSALMKMSEGTHRNIKLKEQDTVILSSTPIPESGNDINIGNMVDDLVRKNVHVFEHRNHELDGVGPLHVSGHASRDEYVDMINYTRPKFFMPIYGAFRVKQRHLELAVEQGIPRANAINAENGQVIGLTPDKIEVIGEVPSGTVLVDQAGMIVSGIVVKDRVLLAEEGLVAVILTIDRKSGQLMTSPDIISRGFIYMRDNEELVSTLRAELKRAVQQRFKRIDLDRFKAELKDHITHYLFEHTGGSPIVIPVVNIVGGPQKSGNQPGNRSDSGPRNTTRQASGSNNSKDNEFSDSNVQVEQSPEQLAADQQKRFQEMRARLLGQDPRTD